MAKCRDAGSATGRKRFLVSIDDNRGRGSRKDFFISACFGLAAAVPHDGEPDFHWLSPRAASGEALLFGSPCNDRECKIPTGTLARARYVQHSLERNILGKELTLYPAERENYVLTRLKADLATKNICEQKRELGTICRFDDAMSSRVKTFDLPLQVTPSWLGR